MGRTARRKDQRELWLSFNPFNREWLSASKEEINGRSTWLAIINADGFVKGNHAGVKLQTAKRIGRFCSSGTDTNDLTGQKDRWAMSSFADSTQIIRCSLR